MTYCFDVDGTICTNTDGKYEEASSFSNVIDAVNKLYDDGHKIYFYTARGSTTGIDWSEITKKQLRDWGVKFHRIFFGKPTADIYIDDKAINVLDWKRENL